MILIGSPEPCVKKLLALAYRTHCCRRRRGESSRGERLGCSSCCHGPVLSLAVEARAASTPATKFVRQVISELPVYDWLSLSKIDIFRYINIDISQRTTWFPPEYCFFVCVFLNDYR